MAISYSCSQASFRNSTAAAAAAAAASVTATAVVALADCWK